MNRVGLVEGEEVISRDVAQDPYARIGKAIYFQCFKQHFFSELAREHLDDLAEEKEVFLREVELQLHFERFVNAHCAGSVPV